MAASLAGPPDPADAPVVDNPGGAGIPRDWHRATLAERLPLSSTAATLVLDAPGIGVARAGQRVELRLTAADGYRAQRAYSLSRVTAAGVAEVAVQATPGGEISPFLVHQLALGDELEVRGPIGGWFSWTPAQTEPVLLVGGGSGVTPLMAVLREHRRTGAGTPLRLVHSVRTPQDAWWVDELAATGADGAAEVLVAHTRQNPAAAARPVGRLAVDDLWWRHQRVDPTAVTAYVCGPSGFVEHVSDLLLALDVPAARIRTERFGF